MKRIGNLFDFICDEENLRLAHSRARRGKRCKRAIARVDADLNGHVSGLAATLRSGAFTTSPYRVSYKRSTSGKTRMISALPYWPDRVVHHAIMLVLEPIWRTVLIRDTYAAIPGRGVHDGVRRIRQMMQDRQNTEFCLKLDVEKFYPSVDHAVLKTILATKIKCRKTLQLLYEIVDSAPGLPIGNYLSQYFGNLYLAYFDHWMKEHVHARYYARYCDDVVIFSHSKRWLHSVFAQIADYLRGELHLTVKGNWQVFPVRVRGLDFLGYRFFGDRTLVRKSIACRFRRCACNSRNNRQALAGYRGWLKHADACGLWRQYAGGLNSA